MENGDLTYLTDDGLKEYTWEDVSKHSEKDDMWIVIEGYVYNVTAWKQKHPGGDEIISLFAGQNATEAWDAFHINKDLVHKYMKPIRVGKVKLGTGPIDKQQEKASAILEDFKILKTTAEKSGYFKASPTFYVLMLAQVMVLELLGWLTLYKYGTGLLPLVVAVLLLALSQGQAAYAQHDYGHLSVFHNKKYDYLVQTFLMSFFKGASAEWWNYRHSRHHAKTNVLGKDPQVNLDPILLVGETVAAEYGRKKKSLFPYLHQHQYFAFVMPPLLVTFYLFLELPYFLIKRRLWRELILTFTFYLRWILMFSGMFSVKGLIAFYFAIRLTESQYFVWVSQMSHMPLRVEYELNEDWVTMQVKSTCNAKQSMFNDWFTGHLNLQIEHHLFPSMPCHNLKKVAPLVKSLCEKHGLEYLDKPLLTALADIVDSLRSSGEAWWDAYNM